MVPPGRTPPRGERKRREPPILSTPGTFSWSIPLCQEDNGASAIRCVSSSYRQAPALSTTITGGLTRPGGAPRFEDGKAPGRRGRSRSCRQPFLVAFGPSLRRLSSFRSPPVPARRTPGRHRLLPRVPLRRRGRPAPCPPASRRSRSPQRLFHRPRRCPPRTPRADLPLPQRGRSRAISRVRRPRRRCVSGGDRTIPRALRG